MRKALMMNQKRNLPLQIPIHLFLMFIALTMIVPFYWMIATALKPQSEILAIPPILYPLQPTFDNFVKVFAVTGIDGTRLIGSGFLNSLTIATSATFGTLFTSSLAAYAFAKVRFKFHNLFFIALLSLMMIPNQITLIPLYIVFARMGWVDTLLPMIIPVVMLNPFGVFLLRQYILGIPDAYGESAKLDGANHFQIYSRIILPLCKPALISLGLLTFIGRWNDFLGPLIYISTETRWPLPLIINSFRGRFTTEWGVLMAAATMAVIPILIIYLIAQKTLIEGIATTSGLKG
jgi:multiple sugar transport system permease protein